MFQCVVPLSYGACLLCVEHELCTVYGVLRIVSICRVRVSTHLYRWKGVRMTFLYVWHTVYLGGSCLSVSV